MTPRRTLRSLPLAWGIAAALAVASAGAQEPPSYQDRIIAPEKLAQLPADEDESETDASETGLPRTLRADLMLSRSERGDEHFNEHGATVSAFWETATLGSFSFDATAFRSDRDRFDGAGHDGWGGDGWSGTATLWQRNLAFDGGWRGDNGLGVLNTPALPLQRNQYRFALPTVAFAGASSEWRDDDSGLRLHGALGRAGSYHGARVLGFDAADGTVAALGAQWAWAPQWQGALAFLGNDGRIVPDAQGEAAFVSGDTRALYGASAWQGDRAGAQVNLIASDGDRGPAQGAWLDAQVERGRYRHHAGVYRLARDLAWGALPINNDVQGGYYRLGYQYARWQWSLGLDGIDSLSGAGSQGYYANGYVRYQASSTLGYGASASLRDTAARAYSTQWFVDRRSRWGQTRWQFDQAAGDAGFADSWQFGVDHAFALKQGARLSASLAQGELAYDGRAATATTTLGLYGGRDLTDSLALDGNVRWLHGDGPDAMRGTDFNVALNWRLAPRWLLVATFFQSQGSRRSPFILDPLATQTPFLSLPRDRSVFLSLRYERNAGRPQAVLGGAPGEAVGSVSGSLFLDDNADGLRNASEQAAVNVTVVLDGRYSARTDSLGRFEFPRVATGSHSLSVVPDNLPLPWFIEDVDAQRSLQVMVRQDTHVDIGARRQR